MSAPAEVLTAKGALAYAADLLELRGVARGVYYDPRTGSFCVAGALMAAMSGDEGAWGDDRYAALVHLDALTGPARGVHDQALGLVGDQVGLSVQESGPGVVMDWNDRTEPAEVIATVRAAAEAAP